MGELLPASVFAGGAGAELVVRLGEDTAASVLVAAADVAAADVVVLGLHVLGLDIVLRLDLVLRSKL